MKTIAALEVEAKNARSAFACADTCLRGTPDAATVTGHAAAEMQRADNALSAALRAEAQATRDAEDRAITAALAARATAPSSYVSVAAETDLLALFHACA